ncbi:fibronectin type III domain-containing protein, partial [Romboutsia ilealis]
AKWSKVSVNKAKTPTITNVKGKKLKISYKATTGAKGYQIQYSTSKKFSKPTSITKTTKSYTSKALKKNKTYYVRVRAYKLDSTGAKVYGKWSTVKSKKITK